MEAPQSVVATKRAADEAEAQRILDEGAQAVRVATAGADVPEPDGSSMTSQMLRSTLAVAIMDKPNDRSERDRHFAVLITDLEKAVAWCEAKGL